MLPMANRSLTSNTRNQVHFTHYLCMLLSALATTRLAVVSSLAFAPSRHLLHRTHNSRRYYLQTMSPPSNVAASLSISALPEDHARQSPIGSTSDAPSKNMIAKCVPATLSSLAECGARLRSGNLVSFPTETVYGLGCHALDPVAVQKVFDAKERPLSDPLIVHVTNIQDALELWDASCSKTDNGKGANNSQEESETATQQLIRQQKIEKKALTSLTQSFFPGPLTLVAKAHPTIPQILMANTGYVACRSPSHVIARALIDAAGVPIAAPSANKFGHVSPTRAEHVMDDLGGEDVWVVDPLLGCLERERKEGNGNNAGVDEVGDNNAVCQVGVESTVAKIEMYRHDATEISGGLLGSVSVLRHGAISSRSIQEALEKAGLAQYFIVSDAVRYTSEEVNNVAPGQTVKHYSPNVPCFMIASERQRDRTLHEQVEQQLTQEERDILSQSVIIDYSQQLSRYKEHSLAYRDLSPEGNASKAASQIFDTLRWSESIRGANRVYVPDLSGIAESANNSDQESEALVLAVKDKLTRAASGVVIGTFQ